jgi:hypothetical protein
MQDYLNVELCFTLIETRKTYRRCALNESIFSSVKRKLSARAPGRALSMQIRQALLLGSACNIYKL